MTSGWDQLARLRGIVTENTLTANEKCLKSTLIISNVVFLIFGCVLTGIASVALKTPVGVLSGVTLPAGILTLGVFIMCTSLLGCLGAWREKTVILGLYAVILAIMILLLLAVGIAVYTKKDQANYYITDGWMNASPDVRNSLQQAYSCCGLNYWNETLTAYQPCPTLTTSQQPTGCLPVLAASFNSSFKSLGATGIAFAVLMAIGLTFSLILMRGIRKLNEDSERDTARIGYGPSRYRD